jgi:hypothetical protein
MGSNRRQGHPADRHGRGVPSHQRIGRLTVKPPPVLAIPAKRSDHTIITFLTEAETGALLTAPDRSTRTPTTPCSCSQSGPACGLPN